MPSKESFSWIRPRFFPHMWCPGCGHGVILNALLRTLVTLGLDQSKTVLGSGIGCSSRLPGYVDACTLHTTHGRSLAYVTGIKMSNPELTCIDVMGDGDCTAIGGNHFIHACRRNIDITAIVMNNNIYGMTGGQMSPTSLPGSITKTAPYGVLDPSFDICQLAKGAGATYVARTTVATPREIEKYLAAAIKHKGFSVLEIVTHCHTQFGRYNKLRTPMNNMDRFKALAVPVKKAETMSAEELEGKIITGEFVNVERPEYSDLYYRMVDRVKED